MDFSWADPELEFPEQDVIESQFSIDQYFEFILSSLA